MLCLFSLSGFSQVGIGTTNPNPAAVLDISSTSQGVLMPRLTTAQRTGLTTLATGLLVYDTTENAFYYYDGSQWISISSSNAKKTGWVAMTDGDYSIQIPGINIADITNPANFTNIDLDFSGGSDSTIDSYAPTGYTASDFFDSTTHRLTPLATGDAVELRLQFDAVPDANNAFMVISLDIGNPSGIIIFQKTVPLLRGSGATNKVSESILLYQLGTFLANGAALRFAYSTTSGSPGNVQLSNFNLVVNRIHAGN